ncbi:MAG: diacylglycerol kinase family protein [Acidobacteriota bacterium]
MYLKTQVIVNPISSKGKTEKKWNYIKEALKNIIKDFKFIFTEKPFHATEIARESIKNGYELIVGVGGDGTINEIANGFMENDRMINPEASLGVIPSGTGNDFVKNLNIPKKIKESIRILKEAKNKKIDIGKVAFYDKSGDRIVRYFLNVADFGIGGEIVKRVNFEDYKKRGKWCYWKGLLYASLHYKSKNVKILMGKSELKGNYFIGAVANGKIFGGNMKIAPYAEIDDGYFDFILVEDISLWEILKNSVKLMRGTHLSHPKVSFFREKEIEVFPEKDEEILLDLDGEQPGMLPAKFEIIPSSFVVKSS